MADSALAFTFYPLDLTSLSGIGSPAAGAGTVLQGPTNYFGDRFNDGTKNKLGTFTVSLVSQTNAAANRPVGNNEGDLVLGTNRGGGALTIRIDFSPLNGFAKFLPGLKVTQVGNGGPVGPASPFNPLPILPMTLLSSPWMALTGLRWQPTRALMVVPLIMS
ncbi:MAG: hypothetical protein HC929_06335 [Leptolyngbyaceae cyanobacterium SM2_5_2]|nr:hypothetical protein [Leptolyngbyaceae cyanobacterium SM2_5_2]